MTRQFNRQPVIDQTEIRPYEIYVLENESYVYVGSAWKNTATWREHQHRRGAGGAKALYDALQAGIELTLRVVETGIGTHQDSLDAEQRILDVEIAKSRKVLNINIYPATQGYARSPETRRKMSEAQRRRYEDPTQRARRSELSRKLHEDQPELREALRQRNIGGTPHPNFVYGMKGRQHSDETKVRHSTASRRNWADPEIRERIRAGVKASWEKRRQQKQSSH